MALPEDWFNSFHYQKKWAQRLKMSSLLSCPAAGTERNSCTGATSTELLHTGAAQEAVQHTGRASSWQQSRVRRQGSHKPPQNQSLPWCPTAESVYKVLSRRTQPLAKSVACRGSTSLYTVCILATVTSKGRNTTGVCLVVKWALLPGTPSTALPCACSWACTAPSGTVGRPQPDALLRWEMAAASSDRAARRVPPAALAPLPTAAQASWAVLRLPQSQAQGCPGFSIWKKTHLS